MKRYLKTLFFLLVTFIAFNAQNLIAQNLTFNWYSDNPNFLYDIWRSENADFSNAIKLNNNPITGRAAGALYIYTDTGRKFRDVYFYYVTVRLPDSILFTTSNVVGVDVTAVSKGNK